MKIYKFAALFKCLMIISCLAFIAACEKENTEDTNQLAGQAVTLQAFGPCPIQRGAELRIIGANLDKVISVVLPGCGEITDPSLKRVSNTEIRIESVPQNAEPGFIILRTSDKDIPSVTELTFDEPILINGITPLTIKAGGVIKIEGDYLNLIKEVIFLDDVHVLQADFVSQSREAIEIVVPITAQTGKVIVSNGADLLTEEQIAAEEEPGIPLWIYSDEELNVVLPTITAFSPGTIRAGSELTITGEDFDLVKSVSFGGDKIAESFTKDEENTTITVTVPEDAQDGEVVLIAFSGVQVLSETELIMKVPTISAIAPNPVKNGAVLKVTGADLDLISEIVFGGDTKVTTFEEGGTATEINVKVPDEAKDGKVAFVTLANKEVLSEALTLVKPEVKSYSPSPVPAGSDVKLIGTNLDLVVSVTFAGDLVVPVNPDAADELTVKVPVTAVSGVVELTMVNGEKIKCPELQVLSPIFAFIPELPEPGTEIFAGEILVVEILNGDKLMDVQMRGASVQYILNGTVLYVLVPRNASGNTELKLVSSNGEVAYTIPVIGMGFTETVIWEGPWVLQWSDCPRLNKDIFESIPAGSTLKVYLTVTNSGSADLAFIDANWGKINTGHPDSKGDFTVAVFEGTTSIEIELTAEILHRILTTDDGWSQTGLMFQGDGAILAKASVITAGGGPAEEIVTNEEMVLSWSAVGIPNANFGEPKAGSILTFYFASLGGDPKIKLFYGDWRGPIIIDDPNFIPGGDDNLLSIPAGSSSYSVVLTEEMANMIMNPTWGSDGMLLMGQDVTLSKITIIY